MDFPKSSLFTGLASRLQYLAARTSILAENVANADTPGYVARDLKAPEFGKRLAVMRASDPRHLQAGTAPAHKPHAAPDGEASLSGNKVSIETQMMKLSEARMDYQLASTVYRKGIDLIRMAARGGR
ncbi:MAG: flagellar biosynthesis protein FlgB [Parvularculaceae bacterium]|nr:flagellar biosynthesis protein FlgB [Parvularculaceae bacterium]